MSGTLILDRYLDKLALFIRFDVENIQNVKTLSLSENTAEYEIG